MESFSRRDFLRHAAVAATGAMALGTVPRLPRAQVLGANGAIRVAVIGFRSMGMTHINQLTRMPGVRLAALCDLDPQVLEPVAQRLRNDIPGLFTTTDFRAILDRNDIDAVTIATPNHWHAPMTIMACQAGKDVYVEKPVEHTIWEGRKMVEAAAKYGRIVQAGTQTRSDDGAPQAIEYVRSGKLGRIQYIYCLWFKRRESIGRRLPWYPDWLDYNLFCGSAPMRPLERNQLHYDWHWMWDTGNGDLANLGNHMIDLARWFAGLDKQPARTISFGGRFGVDDAGETPNTQLTVFDYPDFPVFMENRGLPMNTEIEAMDHVRRIREGIIVQCEHGYYAGYHGGGIYDNEGQRIESIPGDGGATHMRNFIEAVRSRRATDLRAPIEPGHKSTSTCLLGNVSYRAGGPADLATIRRELAGMPGVAERIDNIEQHLTTLGVDLAARPLTLGAWVHFNPETETIESVDGPTAHDRSIEIARHELRGTHREPFVIRDEV